MKKAIVIGSGFGGLAIAIRLQAKGYDVTIFEKNEKIGGHAYQFKEKGYTFDMGPSLITAPNIINKLFETANRKLEDYLELIELDPFYRIYFHDGSVIDYSGYAEEMKTQMAKFNKEDATKYDEFMEYVKQLYKVVIEDGLGSIPFDLQTMIKFMPAAMKLNALFPAYTNVARFFKDPRHRFLFSFHPLFIGGSPFSAPSVYLMIPYLEKVGGVSFTNGGMYSVVKALEKVFLELGGKIKTSSEVEKILVEDKKAYGIRSNNKFYPADLVVSNAHFAHTYLDLVEKTERKKWTDKKVKNLDYSMSSFLLYIGVKKQYPQLLHHTLILSERYKELVKDIFGRKILAEDFSMYLHVPTRTDSSMAPKGCESMYVLIPVPNLEGKTDWKTEKQKYSNKILKFLEEDFGLEGLRENIEVLKLYTPEDFKKQRNNYIGSAWGVEPKLTQTASFRPHNKSEDVSNLYLVGASTHPGAGVPGVLLTAEATEKTILEDFGTFENPKKERQEVEILANT